MRKMGPMFTRQQVICANCHGSGKSVRDKDKCRKCKGTCVVQEKKVLEIYIEKGLLEGEKIVLKGEADEEVCHMFQLGATLIL
jgi:DnaJ family protein A protein 2